jgi:hypothetical protein
MRGEPASLGESTFTPLATRALINSKEPTEDREGLTTVMAKKHG